MPNDFFAYLAVAGIVPAPNASADEDGFRPFVLPASLREENYDAPEVLPYASFRLTESGSVRILAGGIDETDDSTEYPATTEGAARALVSIFDAFFIGAGLDEPEAPSAVLGAFAVLARPGVRIAYEEDAETFLRIGSEVEIGLRLT